MMADSKNHWGQIYATKKSEEVSWTQQTPTTSLNFLHSFNLSKNASIIDIGGGDSRLVDCLLKEGFTNVSVLDISAHALQRAKDRLGEKASCVNWIEADITEFKPLRKYDVWHDRATFHFLTEGNQVAKYVAIASNFVNPNGYLTLGTFSEQGPAQCSGLSIRKYSEKTLNSALRKHFKKLHCILEDHLTPFHTVQNFLFCSFEKLA